MSRGIFGALWTAALALEVLAAPAVLGPAQLEAVLVREAYAAEAVFAPESRAHAALAAVRAGLLSFAGEPLLPRKPASGTAAGAELRRGGFRLSAEKDARAGALSALRPEGREALECGPHDPVRRLDFALGRAGANASAAPYFVSLRLLGCLAAGRLALVAAFSLISLLLLPAAVLDARAAARIRGASLEPGRPLAARAAGSAPGLLLAAALLATAAPCEVPPVFWAAMPLCAIAALWAFIAMKPAWR